MSVKVRNSLTGIWTNIDNDRIYSFDKNTGDVIFREEIVPSNSHDIQVSYTVKNSNILLRHVNGVEIPLNPFNLPPSEAGKPIFIYLMPKNIQYYSQEPNSVPNFVIDQEYAYVSPINWTNDYNIFNKDSANYNPLAIHIATINVINKYSFENLSFQDLRVKGGGISGKLDATTLAKENSNILSFSDIYSGKGFVYPSGGYVIIRIPKEIKNNFTSEEQIYSIVRNNLTAGVSFDLQDLEGNDWRNV